MAQNLKVMLLSSGKSLGRNGKIDTVRGMIVGDVIEGLSWDWQSLDLCMNG